MEDRFLVAQTGVQSESNALFKEDKLFGDLIRADYHEHYSNQSLKIRMGFLGCQILQVFFSVKNGRRYLCEHESTYFVFEFAQYTTRKAVLGAWCKYRRVKRWQIWGSKQEYSGNRYPPFCPGFGVVFSNDVILLFVDLFDVVSKFRLDDVYMGMLAYKSGVKLSRTSNFEFSVNPPPTSKCKWQKSTLLRHGITGDCLFQLFNETVHRVINEWFSRCNEHERQEKSHE